MRVLVACEESQAVCTAFREKGHEAYSCDLQECSGGHTEWHIQGDCLPLLNGDCSFKTADTHTHTQVGRWDMIVAHPPCTYLSNVATRWFSLRCNSPESVVKRWEHRAKAAVFFMRFVLADCERVAVENPVGFMNSSYKKPDQIIHPYQFAESVYDPEYVTKATCLWLKGLNPLITNDLPKPDNAAIFGRFPNGKSKIWEDTYTHSAKVRSKTFNGIAKAMAEQWG